MEGFYLPTKGFCCCFRFLSIRHFTIFVCLELIVEVNKYDNDWSIILNCRVTCSGGIWYAFNIVSKIVISVFLYILMGKTGSWGWKVSSCRSSQGNFSINIESLLVYFSCSLNLLSKFDTKSHNSATFCVHMSWCSFSCCATLSSAAFAASSVIPAIRATIDCMGN